MGEVMWTTGKSTLRNRYLPPGFWPYNSYRSVFQFCLSLFWIRFFFFPSFSFCLYQWPHETGKVSGTSTLIPELYSGDFVGLGWWCVCVFNWQRFCLSCTESVLVHVKSVLVERILSVLWEVAFSDSLFSSIRNYIWFSMKWRQQVFVKWTVQCTFSEQSLRPKTATCVNGSCSKSYSGKTVCVREVLPPPVCVDNVRKEGILQYSGS